MSLYNSKTDTAAQSYQVEQFIVTKFDSDLNVEASYLTSREGCTCPAGIRPTCRHRQMLPNLRQRANTAWFWDFEAEAWVDPTGEAYKPAAAGEAEVEADQASSEAINEMLPLPYTENEAVEADQAPHPIQPKAQSAFRRRI